jgi:ATP/maltotriose-dependent transcriptional regulator MalT
MEAIMGNVTSFTLDDRLAVAGPIAAQFRDLAAQFWDQPHVPPALLELCRLDLAVLHKAEAEQAQRNPAVPVIDQARIDAVLGENWRKSPIFTAAEKAALDFTEYYFVDPQSIPDVVAGAVVGHFGEGGLVCLVEALGFIDSRIRLALIYSSVSI